MLYRRLVLLACVPGLLLSACSSDGNTVALVAGRRFDPATITVTAGDTVTWTVRTDDAHTVTAYEDDIPTDAAYFSSGGFSSEEAARENVAEGLLKEGDTFEVLFATPGTYEYFCIPHESDGMKATVVVKVKE